MFGSKLARELRKRIADYKAKYGMPSFSPNFSGDASAVNQDAVRDYTRIGERAISVMSLFGFKDLKVAEVIWKEERAFFESANDYVLLQTALLYWCRHKGPLESRVWGSLLERWNKRYYDCGVVLVPYWEACGMDVVELENKWRGTFEREIDWYNAS